MTLVIETTIKKKQNYSHSQYQKNSQYLSKQNQNYRKSTSNHQIQINQVQSTNETSPDTPGRHTTESSEL